MRVFRHGDFIGILALAVKKSPLPELSNEDEAVEIPIKANLKRRCLTNLAFGVLALFVYVAVEVIAGDTIGTLRYHSGLNITGDDLLYHGVYGARLHARYPINSSLYFTA